MQSSCLKVCKMGNYLNLKVSDMLKVILSEFPPQKLSLKTGS